MLDRVRIVLDEPQDPVNIASTIRAMKNMGVATLRLVRPVPYDRSRIERVAHDPRDVAERIEHYDSLGDAAADALARAADGPVALLFGREDKGLANDALDRAHVVVTIPTTEHASLN